MAVNVPTEDIKKVLLGINLAPFKSPPVMAIDRWKVYNAGKVPHVSYENQTLNFQVNGSKNEKITVRFFISPDQKIVRIKYYYLKTTDEELAYYVVMELILRVSRKYPLDKNYSIKKLRYL